MKNKIIIALLLIYTITTVVLLVLLGRNVASGTAVINDYSKQLESLASDRNSMEGNISKLSKSSDSLVLLLVNMETTINEISDRKNSINKKYIQIISDLDNKSADSLKIIALQK